MADIKTNSNNGAGVVNFPMNGVYNFKFTVKDGNATASDNVKVTVKDPKPFTFDGTAQQQASNGKVSARSNVSTT